MGERSYLCGATLSRSCGGTDGDRKQNEKKKVSHDEEPILSRVVGSWSVLLLTVILHIRDMLPTGGGGSGKGPAM